MRTVKTKNLRRQFVQSKNEHNTINTSDDNNDGYVAKLSLRPSHRPLCDFVSCLSVGLAQSYVLVVIINIQFYMASSILCPG